MPLTDEQKKELAKLLAEAEPGDVEGYLPAGDVVPKAALKGRLSEKDAAAQKIRADYEAKLAALQQERDEKAAKLAQFENKDKSAEQLFAQQLAAEEERRAAWERKAAEATALAEQRYNALKRKAIREMVTEALAKTGIRPAYTPTALREALAENQLDADDNDGVFSLKVTVDGLPADKPLDHLGQWFKNRPDLHETKGSASPSPGAGTPPGEQPPKDPLEGLTPDQQIAAAMAAGAVSTRY